MAEPKQKFVIRVHFTNNDTYADWSTIYIKGKIPDKAWLKSLYDGVNEPKDMTVLGTILPRHPKIPVVSLDNIAGTYDDPYDAANCIQDLSSAEDRKLGQYTNGQGVIVVYYKD